MSAFTEREHAPAEPEFAAGDRMFFFAQQILRVPKTVRGKILLAYCALAAIIGMLGLAGINSVVGAGDIVVENYDRPLASISYARLALAQFIAMESTLARRADMAELPDRAKVDRHVDQLARATGEFLRLAMSRATSERAAGAIRETARAFASWDAERRNKFSGTEIANDISDLMQHAAIVFDDFDKLVLVTAEDGLAAREQAAASIDVYRRVAISATILALVVGAFVAVLLARRMVRPIAIASRAANRIAQGDLDVSIATESNDEFGELLTAMAAMRDNIRAMMGHEISARRAAQDGLAVAIESSPAGIVLVDGRGNITVANSQAKEFFPDLAERGTPIPDRLRAALGEPACELLLPDGRWLRLGRRGTADDGFVMVATDITVLKLRESELIEAKEGAEATSRAKTDFLANMSHELRTPLNAVIGFSEMISTEMIGPVGQPKYKEFAADILFSGKHLLEIVNHVLDISKLQWGKMAIEREPLDPGEVIAETLRMTRAHADSAQVTLDANIEPTLPRIEGDATRLRQVLLNILSNAVKFTPRGGRIELTARHAGDTIEMRVRDTGIGMKAADIPKALEPFQQADATIARKYGGTGLGLPLSKLFVEQHGGRFAIESVLGQGTTVTITLPISAV